VDRAGAGDLGIDLGKTSCRVRLICPDGVLEGQGSGATGFAAGDAGIAQALAALDAALRQLAPSALGGVRRIGVGAAGVDANRAAATTFAAALAARFGAPVTVVSDALAAHAGALGGDAGTVLIAGTGAVAFHLDRDGALRRADGWGIWLGDLGSGRWIGQEGLRRALLARDLIGSSTSLVGAAEGLTGSLEDLPRYVSSAPQPERLLAAFAPAVLHHAEEGDEVALAIVEEAVGHLAATAAACTPPGERVSVVGGLTSSDLLLARLGAALGSHALEVSPARGDAVTGALLISSCPTLPHERLAIRV